MEEPRPPWAAEALCFGGSCGLGVVAFSSQRFILPDNEVEPGWDMQVNGEGAVLAADRESKRAALVLALCLPGDTLLYLLLPMHAELFGISLLEAGILLAANRLIRILGYGNVVRFYGQRGDRFCCTLAALSALLCALGYTLLSGFWALLGLRLLWGLSFATFNLSTQSLATSEMQGAARRSGRSRALISAGPVLALPLGAWLAQCYGPRPVFLLMALAALIGLVWARGLPERPHPLTLDGKRRLRAPDSMAVWSFIEGLTLDGLFIFGLSLLAQSQLSGGAILVVGCLMAVRYLSEIAFSPLGGHLAERWGALPLLVGSSLLASFALLLFGLDWFVVGAGLVLLLRAVQLPLVATIVAARYPQQRIQALASNAVWRDMGAGLGPLLAGWLVPMLPGAWLYGGAALALALSALACLNRGKTPRRH
jgi:MFS transporter, DHA1 family, inner membrane transport protein